MALLLNTGNTVSRSYTIIKPSPTHPIEPSECGDRTGNLINISTFQDGMHLDVTTGLPTSFGGKRIATMQPIDVSQYNNITVTYDEITHGALFMYSIFSGDTLIERVANKKSGGTIDTSNATKMYLSLYFCIVSDINYIMGNAGSTALPFEPYGVKIPISSASTTTPIYLGEVETTRQIKKLVLTGQESGWNTSSGLKIYYIDVTPSSSRAEANITVCSHYESQVNVSTMGEVSNKKCCFSTSMSRLYFKDTDVADLTTWTTYLQQQYTAGTPVCVWYVLELPQTAVVNEPLSKIGTYADTLSNVSIPVTAGGDTLSVGTTLQPSEVTVNYKGWHPVADVHERDNGAWT